MAFLHDKPSPTTMAVFAILFAAGDPIPLPKIQAALNIAPEALAEALDELKSFLATQTPLCLGEMENAAYLSSKPEYGDFIAAALKDTLKAKGKRLSNQALETLAIIAYKQPVLKSEIDKLRGGSDSESTLNTLMDAGLVAPLGALSKPGSPVYFRTTDKFLIAFKLKSVADLPPLDSFRFAEPGTAG